MTTKRNEVTAPPPSELIVRSAHLAAELAGAIIIAATEAAVLTTDPESEGLLPAMLKGDMFILNGLYHVASVVESRVEPQTMAATRATLDVLRLMTKTPDKTRLEFMTEPELSEHLSDQLKFIKHCETRDTLGTMLVIFAADGICKYGATKKLENVPAALRELADRIERNETVTR